MGGYDGDGDITKTDNLSAFEDYVMELTEGRGVEFVMADGVNRYAVYCSSIYFQENSSFAHL